MNKTARRTGISAISAFATVAVVASYTGIAGQASAASTTGDPGAAAQWLISQQDATGATPSPYAGYSDWGLSINALWAMKAGGASSAAITRTWSAISSNAKDYAGPGNYGISAGASGKLLFAADVVDADPTKLVQKDKSVVNILSQTSNTVLTSGAQKGRLKDPASNGEEYTNAITQAVGVLGLTGASMRGHAVSKTIAQSAIDFLATQQCSGGYFRLAFNDNLSCDAAAKTTSGAPADLDSTSYSLQALMLAKEAGYTVPQGAISAGIAYLTKVQQKDGSFNSGGSNTNSTGLAAGALAGGGADAAAIRATGYIATLQATGSKIAGTKLAPSNGAIAFDQKAYAAGVKSGITSTTADQWRRATADAQFGLVRQPLGALLQATVPTPAPTSTSSSSTTGGTSTSSSTSSTSTGTSTAPGAPTSSTAPTGGPTDSTEPPTPTATTTALPVTG